MPVPKQKRLGCKEINALGQQAAAIQADLLVTAEAETLVERAASALGGPLTVLINNASIFEYDTIEPQQQNRGIAYRVKPAGAVHIIAGICARNS